jgi:hypothetical protein
MISVELTVNELELLTTLATDQLFRKEFIDSKMPGYKSDHSEIALTKILLARLRSVIAENRSAKAAHLAEGAISTPPRVVKRALPFSNRSEKG